jgi:nucleoside phosphorylase
LDIDEQVITFAARAWSWFDDHRKLFDLPDDARVLSRLLTTFLAHVRPAVDIRHSGVHSPSARDNAESFRDAILRKLSATQDQRAFGELRALASDERWPEWSDWLNSLADQRKRDDLATSESHTTARLVRTYRKYGLQADKYFEYEGLATMTSQNVDFGIVAALPEEFEALLAEMSDAKRLDKNGNDTHTYYSATVQTDRADGAIYRIVLTLCPAMGPLVAANTVKALINRWKPRHVLLVGIACGLPSETLYGDLLLPDQIADDTLGKQMADVPREVRWRTFQTGASLFGSAQHVPKGWIDTIKIPRPGSGAPVARHGTVVSGGDVVMDDGLIAEYRAMWPKLVGVEMEAGGAASAVHDTLSAPEFLMIKAVSDHGKDKHEPAVKPWRAYACAVAAAFARAFMQSGPADPHR